MKSITTSTSVRILKRVFGDDTGAVKMKYALLVAMLVAAAIVVALSYFGRDTQGMFGVIGRVIWGPSDEPIKMRDGDRGEIERMDEPDLPSPFSTLKDGPTTRGI